MPIAVQAGNITAQCLTNDGIADMLFEKDQRNTGSPLGDYILPGYAVFGRSRGPLELDRINVPRFHAEPRR
jgi:hypothetical protein